MEYDFVQVGLLTEAAKNSCELFVRGVGFGWELHSERDRMSSQSRRRRFYEGALASFGKIAEKSVNEASSNSRKRTFQQFQGFSGAKCKSASPSRQPLPADVGAFIVGDWIPSHSAGCRTKLPANRKRAFRQSSAVTHVVKGLSLSRTLLLGYEGRSNPAKSEVVKSFRVGYEKMLHEQGVKVKRAKVFTEAEVGRLCWRILRD